MDIFSIFSLIGGFAFFLFGMKHMSDGLEKASEGKLNKYFGKITTNKFVALFFGAALTAAVQSSSAVSVMLVGLVNSGIIEFGQAISVLMGSNIGTTMTAWILSLAGIESDNVFVSLFKPSNFSPLLAFVGIMIIMLSKKPRLKEYGNVLVGFAVLMTGMTLMSDAMKPLSSMPEFTRILTAFENPILCIAFGAIFTGIIQSSSASVAVLQAFSIGGGITYGTAIPIIMGQNIGTCITAIISSIGVNKNAKKVPVVHLLFNIFGTLICLVPFCIFKYIVKLDILDESISPFMIAVAHSVFNVLTTVILFPFTKQLEKLTNKILPVKEEKDIRDSLLDDRLLVVPTVAIERAFEVVSEMCVISKRAYELGSEVIFKYDEDKAADVIKLEDTLDAYEDRLGTYLIKFSKSGLSEADSKTVAKILHTIDDFERIGDHAIDLLETAKEINTKKITFSPQANDEIEVLHRAVSEIVDVTSRAFTTGDIKLAAGVEPLEQVIDNLILKAKRNHINRLREEKCTIELGFVLSDMLTSFERISDHCSNVAVAVIESQHGTFDTHKYLEEIRYQGDSAFDTMYEGYSERFSFKSEK